MIISYLSGDMGVNEEMRTRYGFCLLVYRHGRLSLDGRGMERRLERRDTARTGPTGV